MKRLVVNLLVISAVLSGVGFVLLPTMALAAPVQPVIEVEPIRLDGGDPDNDHTPIYGPDGQLIYPIYDQGPAPRRVAAITMASAEDGCLPTPVADGRYGDIYRTDAWARVAVERCDDRLTGVAWSRWPGRNPIATGHDRQNMEVHVEVVDLTTGKTVESYDTTLSNNPREQGVLYFIYDFELPANGHEYELRMQARVKQNTCGNGSNEFAEASAKGSRVVIACNGVEVNPSSGGPISAAGQSVNVTVNASNAREYWLINADSGEVVAERQRNNQFSFHAYPGLNYRAMLSGGISAQGEEIIVEGCLFSFLSNLTCELTSSQDTQGNTLVQVGAADENGNAVEIDQFRASSNFSYEYEPSAAENLPVPLRWPGAKEGNWFVQFEVSADEGQTWVGGSACRLKENRGPHTTSQYQDFIGAVPFGRYTPYLEPGKEYFDGPRSLMYNVEYLTEAGQGDVVFRFNGQEVSDVTSSLFNAGGFQQIESVEGRAVTSLDAGVTKLIAYRHGAEQARIFQTVAGPDARWIHPLDQPFEHKYQFQLELHGPPNASDMLVYGAEQREVRYDADGRAVMELNYDQAGLVAIYPGSEGLAWITVDSLSGDQAMTYNFAETGLYHYRIVDAAGQVVAGPSANSQLAFDAEPGVSYLAQLAYPATSLFVGLYDDMQFEHTPYWTMPVDGRTEHDFEFHLDYHRLDDPDLGDAHIRGDVVVDALYLINGTTSVAGQFPHGRHDAVLPGVTIVGIPDVSMVAFCARPGVHEVVYWGGWENESYYLPERGWIFDQEIYDEWTEDQRGDCVDAAHRVNMLLAREGLRTDHTFRHHGQRSQGYQMTQQHIWSPYNLAGMRPPHLGRLLKPGDVLPYYQAAEDLLFWGWDLDAGSLAEGLGAAELQAHTASLGAVEYVDQTGIHPADELNR